MSNNARREKTRFHVSVFVKRTTRRKPRGVAGYTSGLQQRIALVSVAELFKLSLLDPFVGFGRPGRCWVHGSPGHRVTVEALPRSMRVPPNLAEMALLLVPAWADHWSKLHGLSATPNHETVQVASPHSNPNGGRGNNPVTGCWYFSFPRWGKAGLRVGWFAPVFHVKKCRYGFLASGGGCFFRPAPRTSSRTWSST